MLSYVIRRARGLEDLVSRKTTLAVLRRRQVTYITGVDAVEEPRPVICSPDENKTGEFDDKLHV